MSLKVDADGCNGPQTCPSQQILSTKRILRGSGSLLEEPLYQEMRTKALLQLYFVYRSLCELFMRMLKSSPLTHILTHLVGEKDGGYKSHRPPDTRESGPGLRSTLPVWLSSLALSSSGPVHVLNIWIYDLVCEVRYTGITHQAIR